MVTWSSIGRGCLRSEEGVLLNYDTRPLGGKAYHTTWVTYVSLQSVLTNALRDKVAEQTGLPDSTVGDILRPVLKENIDALRALLDEDGKEP